MIITKSITGSVESDVVICGGGPSGWVAAVAAAVYCDSGTFNAGKVRKALISAGCIL